MYILKKGKERKIFRDIGSSRLLRFQFVYIARIPLHTHGLFACNIIFKYKYCDLETLRNIVNEIYRIDTWLQIAG